MKEKGHRQARLQELIFEEVSTIVPLEMEDPRVMNCRITRVELAADLKTGKVYFVDPDAPDRGRSLEEALNHAARFVAGRVGEYLPMKGALKLRFLYDEAEEKAKRLEALFEQISHGTPAAAQDEGE